nr:glycosyltransferase [Paenibacillus bovis]
MEKKKVALLVPSLKNGGAERVVSRLSSVLKKYYDVYVIIFDKTAQDYKSDSILISLDEKSDGKQNIFKKLIRAIRRVFKYNNLKKEIGIDLTYSFGDSANIVNILSKYNDKKITSIRGYAGIKEKKGLKDRILYRPIYKYIHNKAHCIVCVSKVIQQKLLKEYNVEESKTSVIYNGYNTREILKLTEEAISKEEEFLFNNKITFINIASYRYEKGLWHLIKAFSKVVENNENAQLIILGRGTAEKEARLKGLIKELSLENYVHLLGFKENVYKYLKYSYSYVLSSISEGFPNGMVEAMASGIPVIATDCKSGPREILCVDNDINKVAKYMEIANYGILVPPQSPVEDYASTSIDNQELALADAMIELINNPELQREYKQKSFERVSDFSYERWADKHLDLFSSIFKRR